MPSGPSERTVTVTASRSPLRVGVSVVTRRRRSPGGTSSGGCRARPRRGRPGVPEHAPGPAGPGFSTISSTVAVRRAVPAGRRAGEPQRSHRARQQQVDRDQRREQQRRPGHGQARPGGEQHDQGAQQGQQRGPSCQRHSAGDGDGGEDGVDEAVGGRALQLGLGAELDPVPHRRPGQRLDVVGGDVGAAGQPGPGAGAGQQRGRATGRDAELERGEWRVALAMSTM